MNWDDALKAAIVGTQSGPPAGLPPREPEEDLLLLASRRQVELRSGFRPLTGVHPQDGAQADLHTHWPVAYEPLLKVLLRQKSEALLDELVQQASIHGFICPPVYLQSFMDRAAAYRRSDWSSFIGERGRWLAKQSKDWKILRRPEERDWEVGKIKERVAYLEYVRAVQPEAARELLEEAWPKEPVRNKAKLLQALSVNSSEKDRAFVEACFEEADIDVREVAGNLLLAWPQSELTRFVSDYGLSRIKPVATGGKLASLQLAYHKASGSGFKEERMAEWVNANLTANGSLSRCFSYVDPQRYADAFGLAVPELISLFEANEPLKDLFKEQIMHGIAYYGRKEWALAVAHYFFEKPIDKKLKDYWGAEVVEKALRILGEEKLDAFMTEKMLKAAPQEWYWCLSVFSWALKTCPPSMAELLISQFQDRFSSFAATKSFISDYEAATLIERIHFMIPLSHVREFYAKWKASGISSEYVGLSAKRLYYRVQLSQMSYPTAS